MNKFSIILILLSTNDSQTRNMVYQYSLTNIRSPIGAVTSFEITLELLQNINRKANLKLLFQVPCGSYSHIGKNLIVLHNKDTPAKDYIYTRLSDMSIELTRYVSSNHTKLWSRTILNTSSEQTYWMRDFPSKNGLILSTVSEIVILSYNGDLLTNVHTHSLGRIPRRITDLAVDGQNIFAAFNDGHITKYEFGKKLIPFAK